MREGCPTTSGCHGALIPGQGWAHSRKTPLRRIFDVKAVLTGCNPVKSIKPLLVANCPSDFGAANGIQQDNRDILNRCVVHRIEHGPGVAHLQTGPHAADPAKCAGFHGIGHIHRNHRVARNRLNHFRKRDQRSFKDPGIPPGFAREGRFTVTGGRVQKCHEHGIDVGRCVAGRRVHENARVALRVSKSHNAARNRVYERDSAGALNRGLIRHRIGTLGVCLGPGHDVGRRCIVDIHWRKARVDLHRKSHISGATNGKVAFGKKSNFIDQSRK